MSFDFANRLDAVELGSCLDVVIREAAYNHGLYLVVFVRSLILTSFLMLKNSSSLIFSFNPDQLL